MHTGMSNFRACLNGLPSAIVCVRNLLNKLLIAKANLSAAMTMPLYDTLVGALPNFGYPTI